VLLDRAFSVLRRANAELWLRAMSAGLPLAAAALLFYCLERALGVHAPRPLFALLFALGYWLRFVWLSRVARAFVSLLAPGLTLAAPEPSLVQSASTAALVGMGACVWALPLLSVAQQSVIGLLLCLPFMSVRGALMPSLLARAACSSESGWAALSRAWGDSHGVRPLLLGLWWLASLCQPLLIANLFALTTIALVLGSNLLGLDVAAFGAFLSPENDVVLLCFLGLSSLLLEPLRAALSAIAYCEARQRIDGADLHVTIDNLGSLLKRSQRRTTRAASGLLVVAVALSVLWSASAHAEPVSDDAVRGRAQQILQRQEFREFEGAEPTRWDLLEWLQRWLEADREREREPISPPGFQLALPTDVVVVLSVVLFLAVLGYAVWHARSLSRPAAASAITELEQALPSALSSQLSAAARASAAGDYTQALRVLYSACLYALARAHAFRLEPARTNGEYVRAVAVGPARDTFNALTGLFERVHYGEQTAGAHDYAHAQQLAKTLLEPESERA
jgi:hypothetical protein